MNKKILKYGAGSFAVICFFELIKFLSELGSGWARRDWFEGEGAISSFLIIAGIFWGLIFFFAIDAGENSSTDSASDSSTKSADNSEDTPFKMVMKKLKGESTENTESATKTEPTEKKPE